MLYNHIIEMAQLRREDAGNSGSTFYYVNLQPRNWYKWFLTPPTAGGDSERDGSGEEEEEDGEAVQDSSKRSDSKTEDDDSGWTEVR